MRTAEKTCRSCNGPLPAASRGGLCPACLLGEGVNSLDTLADETASLPPATSLPPGPDPLESTTLGPEGRYKILQRIGEGGFGTVYMADQVAPVKRRVAIKILKPGMDTHQVVARFEAERQALAMMDHPNIAKVLDGGETELGRPFFVMELVRGTPITEFCDEEALPTRQRLDLFLKVCRAVQHAHQKGIIHRDLKPGNILVTLEDGADPVPKVIDFGVAKAMETSLTDKTLFTRFEQMIGTPAYMSPEQASSRAAHDLDTRADIYALGVLLYELLTGTTPFESQTLQKAAFDEVRRILREEEAPRPSARLSSLEQERRTTIAQFRGSEANALGKLLRGDLDWIVMKAIEKDRKRRYETANALALDVERHLEDEPVLAGPPTLTYRAGKFLRKHRVGVGVAAMLLFSLVGGLALAGMGFARAKEEARKSRAAEEVARKAEAAALDSARKAKTEAGKAQAINDFLVADVLEGSFAGHSLRTDDALPAALDDAAESVDERFADQPLVCAEVHDTLRENYVRLRRWKKALHHSKIAYELFVEALGKEARETLRAKRFYGEGLDQTAEPARALLLLEETLAQQIRTLGDSHVETLYTRMALAGPLENEGRLEEAEKTRRRIVSDIEARYEPTAPELAYHCRKLGAVIFKRGKSPYELERLKEAEALHRRSIAIRKQGRADPNYHYLLAISATERDLANILVAQGRRGEAIKMLADSVKAWREEQQPNFFPQAKRERGHLESLEECYLAHSTLEGAEELFLPRVKKQVEEEGLAKTNGSWAQLAFMSRFAARGEEGLRELLRDLAKLSATPVSEELIGERVQEAPRAWDFRVAVMAGRGGDLAAARRGFELWRECGGNWEEHPGEMAGYAAILVKDGDLDAYRDLCDLISTEYAESENANLLEAGAMALLLDGRQEFAKYHAAGAEMAVRCQSQQVSESKNLLLGATIAKALGKIRAQKPLDPHDNTEALAKFATAGQSWPVLCARVRAILAMQCADEGDALRARRFLEGAEELARDFANNAEGDATWRKRLISELLADEARKAVNAMSVPKDALPGTTP